MAENLVEVDTYTADVTVPEPGDDRTAGSVRGAFQALANRSKFLYTRLGDAVRLLPGTELLYANASRVPERRARHDYLPLTAFFTAPECVMGDGQLGISCKPDAGAPQVVSTMQLRLPTGARLSSAHTAVYGVLDTTWQLTTRVITFNPFGAPTVGAAVTDSITMGVAGSATLSTPVNIEINNDLARVEVIIRATRADVPPLALMGMIHCLGINWDDPGPRSGN